ncbi:MAG: phosphatidylglycerol lysyltransferase domain-containing protein [Polyangiales bacterium]
MTRARVLALLREHGEATTSFQVLEPGLTYFLTDSEEGEGCVAYVDTGSAWVAAGPPICARSRRGWVARAFLDAAKRARRRACFFAVDHGFAEESGLSALPLGEDPIWDLRAWTPHKSMREQLRRARTKGVTVRVVESAELAEGHPTRSAMERIIVRWLSTRPLAAMGFLVDVRPFELAEERIVVVAERGGAMVGFAAAVPIYQRRGYFLEDLLRDDAPNGTAEALVELVFRQARSQGAELATLGLAPLSGSVPRALAWIGRRTRGLYNFEGVRAFKARLHPVAWEPVFLAHPPRHSGLVAIWDSLTAFASGGFIRFGVESLRRQRRAVVLVLAVLLIPWALAVALPPEARWFPSRGVQLAWAIFDFALATALLSLFRRWRSAFATMLGVVTAVDALLTLVQIAVWDAPRAHGLFSASLMGIAVVAPSIASMFLFWARGLSRV